MIIANITTYRGQCVGAIHYYCSYDRMPDEYIPKDVEYISDTDELNHVIVEQDEVDILNEQDSCKTWHAGQRTIRFPSIESIHSELKERFKNEIIVTYYENQIFKDMLYLKDGINFGYKHFGEVWSPLYNSVYKDLLPESFTIKCNECGKEYKLNEISTEVSSNNRTIVKFARTPLHLKIKCCNCFDLVWNVVL